MTITVSTEPKPKFKVGDRVKDIFNGREFTIRIVDLITGDSGEPEYFYSAGWYLIPESDLEAVKL